MSAHSEEILHQAVHRHEPLYVGGRLEAPHLPLALPGRLVRDFGAIVRVLVCAVNNRRHHGAERRGVAAQLVRNQSARLPALAFRTASSVTRPTPRPPPGPARATACGSGRRRGGQRRWIGMAEAMPKIRWRATPPACAGSSRAPAGRPDSGQSPPPTRTAAPRLEQNRAAIGTRVLAVERGNEGLVEEIRKEVLWSYGSSRKGLRGSNCMCQQIYTTRRPFFYRNRTLPDNHGLSAIPSRFCRRLFRPVYERQQREIARRFSALST